MSIRPVLVTKQDNEKHVSDKLDLISQKSGKFENRCPSNSGNKPPAFLRKKHLSSKVQSHNDHSSIVEPLPPARFDRINEKNENKPHQKMLSLNEHQKNRKVLMKQRHVKENSEQTEKAMSHIDVVEDKRRMSSTAIAKPHHKIIQSFRHASTEKSNSENSAFSTNGIDDISELTSHLNMRSMTSTPSTTTTKLNPGISSSSFSFYFKQSQILEKITKLDRILDDTSLLSVIYQAILQRLLSGALIANFDDYSHDPFYTHHHHAYHLYHLPTREKAIDALSIDPLSKDVLDLYIDLSPCFKEREMRFRKITALNLLVRSKLWMDCQLEPFGSTVNSLFIRGDGDIDLCLSFSPKIRFVPTKCDESDSTESSQSTSAHSPSSISPFSESLDEELEFNIDTAIHEEIPIAGANHVMEGEESVHLFDDFSDKAGRYKATFVNSLEDDQILSSSPMKSTVTVHSVDKSILMPTESPNIEKEHNELESAQTIKKPEVSVVDDVLSEPRRRNDHSFYSNVGDVLGDLGRMLRAERFSNVQILTQPRVPIVKCRDWEKNEWDVCYENRLALFNSNLVRAYSFIDPRASIMMMVVKAWAKYRGINEAFRGTLSSYGYVLLVIFYLQQVRVLPNLQKLVLDDRRHNANEKLFQRVDGQNVAFLADLAKLKEYGFEVHKNRSNLSTLMYGFFEFYSKFRWDRHVVSIRKGMVIDRQEKCNAWYGRDENYVMCIEDPFETQHNVGRVVKKDTFALIFHEFKEASRDAKQWTVLTSNHFKALKNRKVHKMSSYKNTKKKTVNNENK